MTPATRRHIGIASVILMTSVAASRAVGLLREMAIAFTAGAGREVDAYQLAFILPEILNHVAASGFLSVTFIPMFTRRRVESGEARAWDAFSAIAGVYGACVLLAVAAAMLFAPALVALAAPGIGDPATLAAAARMTRIILPAQLCFFLGSLLMAVQFAHERFLLPALAPLLYNAGIIAGGYFLGPRVGVEGFAWGVLAGALAGNLLLQAAGARRVGMPLRLSLRWRDPAVGEYLRRTLPLAVGLTMTFSTEFLFRFFGSYLPAGSVAVLNFGLRVMLVLVGVFGQAVGTASFPYLSRLAAENDLAEMNRVLNLTLRCLALMIPAAVFLMVVSPEIVRLLFERGRFDPGATRLTAEVLVFLLAGAFAFSAYTVVVRGYYALQDTLFPALFGSLAVGASIPLYILGLRAMGAGGVALAISASGVLQVAVLYLLWSRRSGNAARGEVLRFYGKSALLGLAMAPPLSAFRGLLLGRLDPGSAAGSLAVILLTGALFGVLMLAAAYGLKIREITELAARAGRLLRRR
jgi:putative peptidoglycan lipid II flippase